MFIIAAIIAFGVMFLTAVIIELIKDLKQ